MRFSALVVVGDGSGCVGVGKGRANEVALAIQKATTVARKDMRRISLVGTTIPYEIRTKYGAADVLLKPAARGRGIIAGGSVRAVMEAVGIKDILSKSLGSSNPINVVKATVLALSCLKIPEEEIARRKAA